MTRGAGTSASRGPRRADLEWLRVIATVVVFLAHVSMVFTPWQDYHVQSASESRLLGTFTVLVWPWALPLFMLVAGCAAWYSLEHRSALAYLRERALRILVPLVVGTIVVAPPQMYLRRWTRGEFDGSFLEFLPHFFRDGRYPEGDFSATHLWFLGYLFTYAVMSLPLFVWLKRPGRRVLENMQRGLGTVPGLLGVMLVPVLLSQLSLRGPYPQENDFINDWANHIGLAICFVYGFVLASSEAPRRAMRDAWPVGAVLGSVGTIGMAMLILREDAGAEATLTRLTAAEVLLPQAYSDLYFLWWTLFSCASCGCIVALAGAADRFFGPWSPFLQWASPTAYPFYVFHQMVIVIVAAWVVRWSVGWGVAAVAVLVMSLAVTLVLCELARRWSLARRLFGLGPMPGY